ncbi:hypothetical protein BTJ44_05108 [Bacillus mycoides]|nr:hypothetical protein BTJ44_05108 [Bacillus mycoides]
MYQNIYWIEIMFIGFYQLQDERHIFVATAFTKPYVQVSAYPQPLR